VAAPAVRSAHPDAPEREFLAGAIALPRVGVELLREIDPERDFSSPLVGRHRTRASAPERVFSSPLVRRAHSHLLGHLAAPAEGIAGDDDELRALIAELTLSAAPENASDRELRALRVQLELRGVERQLDHAAPGAREELARRRVE